jgi:hypothetical protein
LKYTHIKQKDYIWPKSHFCLHRRSPPPSSLLNSTPAWLNCWTSPTLAILCNIVQHCHCVRNVTRDGQCLGNIEHDCWYLHNIADLNPI